MLTRIHQTSGKHCGPFSRKPRSWSLPLSPSTMMACGLLRLLAITRAQVVPSCVGLTPGNGRPDLNGRITDGPGCRDAC